MFEKKNMVLSLSVLLLALSLPAFATTINLKNGWTASYTNYDSVNHKNGINGIFNNGDKSIEIDKTFCDFSSPVEITFTRTQGVPSSNTVVFYDEIVGNETGVSWSDYHIVLKEGNSLVAFDASKGVPSALNYDDGSVAFSHATFADYNGLNHGPVAINFDNGTVQTGTAIGISKDGPAMTVLISPNCNSFTLTQIPTPEPATMIFLAAGFAGMVKLRSRVKPSSMKALLVVMALGTLFVLSGSSAQAAWMPLGSSGWSVDYPTAAVTISNPSVSANGTLTFDIEKTFTKDPAASWTPLAIRFMKVSATSPAITEIVIAHETVKNQTPSTWYSYTMATASPASFETDLPTMDHFTGVSLSPDQLEIDFTGGSVAANSSFNVYNTKIDVSDVETGGIFILKEWPSVPEPVSLVLMAVGGLALARRKA